MAHRTKNTSKGTISILGKIAALFGFPIFFSIVAVYAVFIFLLNLIFLAINQKAKGKRGASETFSDHMHELGISIFDAFKSYFLFIFGF